MVKKKIRRLIQGSIILILVSILNFFIFHLSPGDPANSYFGPKTPKTTLDTIRSQRGFDLPWYLQYANWIEHALKGDLGFSWSQRRPVREILAEALPATFQLTFLALLINFAIGSLAGVISSIYDRRWYGKLVHYSAVSLYAMPSFVIALLLIYIFAVRLNWLPVSGMNSLFIEESGIWQQMTDRAMHLVLPAGTLGIIGAAATSRYVRAKFSEILNEDYICFARANGLSAVTIYIKHAFRNALLPIVTLLGLYFPFLLSGVLIIEVIFAWPGMGRLAYEAVFARDYPLLMACNFVAAFMVIIGNMVSDMLYQVVDPRVQGENDR